MRLSLSLITRGFVPAMDRNMHAALNELKRHLRAEVAHAYDSHPRR